MKTELAKQIEYWDRVAPEKRFSHPLRLDWLERELGPIRRQALLIDYGCGYGRNLVELRQAGYGNIVGLDFSAGMLARCRRDFPEARLVRSDGQSLPLRTGSIAAVFLFAVLTCIPDSSEQRRLLSEIHRVLQPRGLIYISDLLINDDERNRARYEEYEETFGCYGVFELPEGVVVRHHSRKWIDELTAAFVPVEFEPFEVLTMNGNTSAAFQYLGRKPTES
jgi:SAM-dependent methyltransferase